METHPLLLHRRGEGLEPAGCGWGVGWEEPRGGYRYEVSTRGRPASAIGGQLVGGMNRLAALEQGKEEAWGQVEDS